MCWGLVCTCVHTDVVVGAHHLLYVGVSIFCLLLTSDPCNGVYTCAIVRIAKLVCCFKDCLMSLKVNFSGVVFTELSIVNACCVCDQAW